MYKLKDFESQNPVDGVGNSSFIKLLKIKWDEIHSEYNVFRYPIHNLHEKLVDRKYLLQLNPNRGTNRRTPEHIVNIRQVFDDTKFNFTKISRNEIMFCIDHDGDEHNVLVNVSPISQYHSLLCPSVKMKLPQVVTAPSLKLALDIMLVAQDCNLKIGFNSLCALASVNHLHYHLFIEQHTLPVQLVKWKQIKSPLYCTEDYPVPAFCFEVTNSNLQSQVTQIFKLLQYFLDNSIAHNILMAMKSNNVTVYIWPRKSTAGVKQLMDFNVAVLELSGWFPVYTKEAFTTLQKDDLEKELTKWKIDNFETLCKDVESLF